MKKFSNKVVLITGASSGIGAATAVAFAWEGAKLALAGRNEVKLAQTVTKCLGAGSKKSDVFVKTGDLGNQDVCQELVDSTLKHFGKIDILVNNAGSVMGSMVRETNIEEIDSMFNILVRAVFAVTQRALPSIMENKGAIINISTQFTMYPQPAMAPYCIAKAALDHYTRILALDLADKGVRVNSVNPGIIVTDIFDGAFTDKDVLQKVFADCGKHFNGNKRAGRPEEVARAVLFLSGEDAGMIAGALLPVGGGGHLAGAPSSYSDMLLFNP